MDCVLRLKFVFSLGNYDGIRCAWLTKLYLIWKISLKTLNRCLWSWNEFCKNSYIWALLQESNQALSFFSPWCVTCLKQNKKKECNKKLSVICIMCFLFRFSKYPLAFYEADTKIIKLFYLQPFIKMPHEKTH